METLTNHHRKHGHQTTIPGNKPPTQIQQGQAKKQSNNPQPDKTKEQQQKEKINAASNKNKQSQEECKQQAEKQRIWDLHTRRTTTRNRTPNKDLGPPEKGRIHRKNAPHHHHTDSRGKPRSRREELETEKPAGKHLRRRSAVRWCGGLAAASSHHHLYHIYMVKNKGLD
jgi:hypothetical protein